MVRALLSKSRATVPASEPPAVPPKDKGLEASVMDLDPTPEENAHADTRSRHTSTSAAPLHTLRPVRRSASRIQRWVQDQQNRLSGDPTLGDSDDVEDSPVTSATASGCDPWLAYPDMKKPSRISVDDKNATPAAMGRARAVHEEDSMDYVVIDAELNGALRNASIIQPRTIDLSASPSASAKPRISSLLRRSPSGTPSSLKGIAAFSFSATARKVSGSDGAPATPSSPSRRMSLLQRVRQNPQRGREREQRQERQLAGHGQEGQGEHGCTSSLGSSIFTPRASHSPASTTRLRESIDTAGPLPTPASWKISRTSSRLHAHFASPVAPFARAHMDTDESLPRLNTSSPRTSFDHPGRPSISTSSSHTGSDMPPAPPRLSTSSSRTRATTTSGDPFALSSYGGLVLPTTSAGPHKLSFARDRERERGRERLGERPPSPASFLSFAPSPASLWSLPTDASHMRDPPGSTKLLASPAPSFNLGSLAIHPRSPSIISGISNRAGSKRKRKLVVSGIAPGDVRKYEQIRRWCEGFGEVNEIVRVPSGDLHVDFRRAEVAETVCRLHARVHINGVGSVGLSWFTGKRP